MREYLTWFFHEFDYPKEGAAALIAGYDAVSTTDQARLTFDEILETYRQNYSCNYKEILSQCDGIATLCDLHSYTVRLLAFICMSRRLRENYVEKGIDLAIWKNSMLDLKYKMIECKLVKGIYGSFVASWFDRFFNMTRFAIGRLQFEVVPFKRRYEKEGKLLLPTSPVINVHIPRTETPLDRQSCLEAYATAKEFFKDAFTDTPMAFVCGSWLLFEELRSFLPETSNIIRFMNDYDVIETKFEEEVNYKPLWRVFDMDYTGNVEDFPGDTTLRRAYKTYVRNGGRLGTGYGVFFA